MARLENVMKRCPLMFGFVLSAMVASGVHAESPFDQHFENATLRIDFHHTGNAVKPSTMNNRVQMRTHHHRRTLGLRSGQPAF